MVGPTLEDLELALQGGKPWYTWGSPVVATDDESATESEPMATVHLLPGPDERKRARRDKRRWRR